MPHPDSTPGPNSGSTSENLFETRKDWPIPPVPETAPIPTIKTEDPPQVAAIPYAMVMPKQATQKCSWGPHCPICENKEECKEVLDGNMQNQPQMHPQNLQHPQPQNIQYPGTQTFSAPSHRTASNHSTFQTGMANK